MRVKRMMVIVRIYQQIEMRIMRLVIFDTLLSNAYIHAPCFRY